MPDGSRLFTPGQPEAYFTLPDVKIGIGFHWQRHMPQSFRGALVIAPDNLIINIVPLEEYLASVISSEMNADAPVEFLKAHAIVSRSWLVAMLRREQALTELLPPAATPGLGTTRSTDAGRLCGGTTARRTTVSMSVPTIIASAIRELPARQRRRCSML